MNPKENLSIEKFNGNVKKVISCEFSFDNHLNKYQELPSETITMTFDKFGDCINYDVKYGEVINPKIYGTDFENYRTEYIYNENRLLIKEINYNENNDFDSSISFMYNSNNELIKRININSILSEQIISFSHIYNEKLNEKTILTHDEDNNQINKNIKRFDDNGKIIVEEFYNPITTLIRKKTHSYHSEFNICEYSNFNTNGQLENKQIIKKNLEGNLVEEISFSKENILKHKIINDFINDKVITTKYNSDNDIIFKQEKKYDSNGKLIELISSNSELIIESHSKFSFKYDENLNEIFSEIYDQINNKPIEKHITVIEYYE